MKSKTKLGCIVFTGCDKKIYHWEIGGSSDEIEKIEIVEIKNFYTYDFEIVCEVDEDNYEELISDVSDLQFKRYFKDPSKPEGKAIRITFKNGNFDLISRIEPKHCYKDEDLSNSRNTYLICAPTEFKQLIEKWINIAQENNS